MDVAHHRALYFDRVILFRAWPKVGNMIVRDIDAADERELAVDHHQLAVQAPKQVGAHAEHFRLRSIDMKADPHRRHLADERGAQVGGSVAVDGQLDADTALRGGDQSLLERLPDFVVEQDEGLDEDFLARGGDRVEYARVVSLTIFEQSDAIAVDPALCVIGSHRRVLTR